MSTIAERRWRRVVASLLVVLAALSATVGVLAGRAERNLFDKEEFAHRARTMLESAAVAVGAAVVAVTAVVPRLAAGSIDDANLADAVRHGTNRSVTDENAEINANEEAEAASPS